MIVTPTKNQLRWELGIVLALSFGAAGVRAIVAITQRMTSEVALSSQQAVINRPLAEQATFDLIYQLLSFVFGLAPVALVIYLVWRQRRRLFPGSGRSPHGCPGGRCLFFGLR